MTPQELLTELYETLQQNHQVHYSDDQVTILQPYGDNIEIRYVESHYTGVEGGTIEIGYENAEENEVILRANETNLEEIVNAIHNL